MFEPLQRELVFDVYYDELLCEDAKPGLPAFSILIVMVFFWLAFAVGVYYYTNSYAVDDMSGDLQACYVLIPIFKAVQQIFTIISLAMCSANSNTAIQVQRYTVMLELAAETVSRTATITVFYLVASVSKSLQDHLD